MVSLELVKSSNAALFKSHFLVAVVTGGTSGIGESTVRALATAHANDGKGLRVYIVGRKKVAAEAIISDCIKASPKGDFRFVQADDLSLLKDVDRVCAEITKAEEMDTPTNEKPRADLLVMCHAHLAFERREGMQTLPSTNRLHFIIT
jgi:NAD(P)-dependent dehydrogenase (short-subunit alcohol dehydrogenase family)